MYFPYLYGRRAERNALIDVAHILATNQKVHPIVEPYSSASDLTSLINAYRTAGAKLHMVVNPSRGGLSAAPDQAAWAAAMSPYIAQPALITPVMHVHSTTSAVEIDGFLSSYPNREIALVVLTGGLSPLNIATTIGTRSVRVFTGPKVVAQDYATALPSQVVTPLVPRFPINVNADYPAETSFSLNPQSYRAVGFGDFALVDPKPPKMGGGGAAAGAVALHMTYQVAGTGELKVQHFLSDDRTQNSPPDALKLLQAIQHLVAQQGLTPGRFQTSPGYVNLIAYLAARKRTSLEKSKQQQLSHHLFTVASCL